MEDGHRTADTLVLTHPPYGLEPTFRPDFSGRRRLRTARTKAF